MVQLFKSPAKKTQKSKTLSKLVVTGIDQKGRGVARQAGKVIFIDGALPDEIVDATCIENKKNHTVARLNQIHQVSRARTKPFCAWYDKCGGCQLQHLNRSEQLSVKKDFVNGLFNKIGIADLPWQPPVQSSQQNYRNRARLAAWYQGKKDRLQIGFRAAGSKKIVAINHCAVLDHPLKQKISELTECLNKLSCKKDIFHVELHHATTTAFIILRLAKQPNLNDLGYLAQFSKTYNVEFVAQLDNHQVYPLTDPSLDLSKTSYQLDGLTLRLPLTAFTQINSQVNQQMVALAINWLSLTAADSVLDLFCGSGNFSLPIAQYVAKVTGYEGVASAVESARQSAKLNQLTNVEFAQLDLADKTSLQQINYNGVNKIILDPSREGAASLCAESAQWSASHVLYIACDANSLVRDSQFLQQNGYQIDKIALLDMFPHTAHVETMALFRKTSR
ncbi:23S rRNA (uracil(1939)-C(5))-methyltransferase [Gayadomonas joobiniege]|uniref:23S rRNA (uracil(1939)-C(5))-methyltransferase n=1 Tax=Gayadomonas joobiniege TaxID=1234606 RepID=UPI0003666B49|nr:23S rRNA (uracil(1939)-C(5))-methyltransferase [Gayadomonas joobiniege]